MVGHALRGVDRRSSWSITIDTMRCRARKDRRAPHGEKNNNKPKSYRIVDIGVWRSSSTKSIGRQRSKPTGYVKVQQCFCHRQLNNLLKFAMSPMKRRKSVMFMIFVTSEMRLDDHFFSRHLRTVSNQLIGNIVCMIILYAIQKICSHMASKSASS